MDVYEEFENIINSRSITPVFQPIVSLKDGKVIGYEALSRGPKGSPLEYPDQLFAAAKGCNRIWDLESLCRVKALEKGTELPKEQMLFINVDPLILKDEKFIKGFTQEFLATHDMCPEGIIFEITEKTAIEDYKSFRATLNHYTGQGYKIAIDDTGSGYSGLKMLSETKPHYVKIDMELIRDINKDYFKQALIKSFVTLSAATNMQLIAEGIETAEELVTLMDLGVNYGQGYFIGVPKDRFSSIHQKVLQLITNHYQMLSNNSAFSNTNYIGQIARQDPPCTPNMHCSCVKEYFQSSTYTGVCIVDKEIPLGLVMKHTLDSTLATQYGVAVFSKRPVALVMDKLPLIVDYYTPVRDVSKAAMARIDEKIYDYVIVTKNKKYYGIVTIRRLLEFTTMLETNYARQANPLTGLPGNAIIQHTFENLLSTKKEYCVLYFDLDNFKAYNNTYGFENGDKILKLVGFLIESKTKSLYPYSSFIGHIGGDDFVAVIESPEGLCDKLCDEIIKEFDSRIVEFFTDEDLKKGYILAMDRKGQLDHFHLTALSIAGIYGNFNDFHSGDDIAQYISYIKKEVKKVSKSSYLIECINKKELVEEGEITPL